MAAAIEIERDAVERAYDRWAPVYDLVFGPVFERGRRASIERRSASAAASSKWVSAPASRCRTIRGEPDRRRGYLRGDAQKARERVDELGLSHVEALEVMDAERLNFPDESFDVVVAQYVVTAVPNPEAALDEFARVLKPGGEIIILSRVGAETGPRKAVEHFIAPAARKLGWRTEFPWQRYASWVARSPRVYLIERRAMPPLGHFSLIRFGKHPAGATETHVRLAAAV